MFGWTPPREAISSHEKLHHGPRSLWVVALAAEVPAALNYESLYFFGNLLDLDVEPAATSGCNEYAEGKS